MMRVFLNEVKMKFMSSVVVNSPALSVCSSCVRFLQIPLPILASAV